MRSIKLVTLLSRVRLRRSFTFVDYIFDPAKDGANRVKHGVSLSLAEVLLYASEIHPGGRLRDPPGCGLAAAVTATG